MSERPHRRETIKRLLKYNLDEVRKIIDQSKEFEELLPYLKQIEELIQK